MRPERQTPARQAPDPDVARINAIIEELRQSRRPSIPLVTTAHRAALDALERALGETAVVFREIGATATDGRTPTAETIQAWNRSLLALQQALTESITELRAPDTLQSVSQWNPEQIDLFHRLLLIGEALARETAPRERLKLRERAITTLRTLARGTRGPGAVRLYPVDKVRAAVKAVQEIYRGRRRAGHPVPDAWGIGLGPQDSPSDAAPLIVATGLGVPPATLRHWLER